MEYRGKYVDKNKVINFVNAYTNLCRQYGLMFESWGKTDDMAVVPISSKRLVTNNTAAIGHWELNNALSEVAAAQDTKKEEQIEENTTK